MFLQNHNKFNEAETYYQRCVKGFGQEISIDFKATTLNNLAVLHSDKNEYEQAQNEYEEALTIYRQLAEVNPASYLPDVAITLINLSIFYLQSKPHQEESIKFVLEAIRILLPIVERIPYTQPYLQTAKAIMKAWGLSDEEIRLLIENKQEM